MNTNSSKKLITILIVVLLIANAATIALVLFRKDPKPVMAPGGPAKYITETLRLDKNQQNAYRTLVEEHQQAVRPLKMEIRDAKNNLFTLLRQSNTSEAEKIAATKKISEYTERLDLVTFNHFAKLRTLCTPAQQEKFDEIIEQVIQMMGMPHGGPRGGRPGEGRPPHDGPPHEGPEDHPPF